MQAYIPSTTSYGGIPNLVTTGFLMGSSGPRAPIFDTLGLQNLNLQPETAVDDFGEVDLIDGSPDTITTLQDEGFKEGL